MIKFHSRRRGKYPPISLLVSEMKLSTVIHFKTSTLSWEEGIGCYTQIRGHAVRQRVCEMCAASPDKPDLLKSNSVISKRDSFSQPVYLHI